MRKFITTAAPKTVTDTFVTAVNNAIAPLAPFKINITDDEKQARSMAEGREGYARLVSRIANQFPNALSRVDVPSELVNVLTYYDQSEACKFALLQALEIIQEIGLGVSIDGMVLVDRYVDNLQIARRNDASLDLAMREVDEFNSRFGVRKSDKSKDDTAPTP